MENDISMQHRQKYPHKSLSKDILSKKINNLDIEGFVDGDWVGDVNDSKSTSGYCCFIGGNLVSQKSKKQSSVAWSSTKAKYKSITITIWKLSWMKHLLQKI